MKRLTLMLIFLASLTIGLFTNCSANQATMSQPKLLTYTNKEYGYAISYPNDWRVEIADQGKTCLLTPERSKTTGTVRIDVIPSIPIERAAQNWEIAMATQWGELTRYENKKTQGQWDWYLSYGWAPKAGIEFLGQAYFKYTPKYIYKVDTAAQATEFVKYPFNSIVSSFRLLE